MIALYSLTASPEETRAHFGYGEEAWFPPRPFISPGQPIGVVRAERGAPAFALVRWGFVPGWAKEFPAGRGSATARAETVLERPAFRNAVRRRRCLVPADGWYAWCRGGDGRNRPYRLRHETGGVFGMAGIFEHWMGSDGSEIETAALMTLAAGGDVADYGERMPAVLAPGHYRAWLEAEETGAEAAVELLAAPDFRFTAEPAEFAPRRRRAEGDQPPG